MDKEANPPITVDCQYCEGQVNVQLDADGNLADYDTDDCQCEKNESWEFDVEIWAQETVAQDEVTRQADNQ